MNILSLILPEPRHGAFVAVTGMLAVFALGAEAQQPTYLDTDNVTVDLSVLDDGGYGSENSTAETGAVLAPISAAAGSRLILPLMRPPVSRLNVPAPRIKLRLLKKASRKAHKNTRVVKAPVAPAPPRTPHKPSANVAAAVSPPVSRSTPPAPPPMAPPVRKSTAKPVPLKKAKTEISEVASIKAPVAPPPMAKPKDSPAKAPVKAPVKPSVAVVEAAAPAAPPSPPRVDEVKTPVAAASKQQKATTGDQLASLPSAGGLLKSGLAYRVIFATDASKLPGKEKKGLKLLAEKVKNNDNMRLQLHAYAGDASLSSSKARRLSLSRALSVRSYLIESGVRSTRIDVRALGNKTKKKPLNRVDINVVQR